MSTPIDLKDRVYSNLADRLRRQAKNVSVDGYPNASRLMLNAADLIDFLVENDIIKV